MFVNKRYWSLLLISVGLGFLLAGSWIPLKAELAQWLIHRAWEQGEPSKPWPWADIKPIAHLQIPRLNKQWYVMSDSSGEALAFGPGLHASGANSETKIIAAHRDTHFA
ncbi:MAG: class GN sortase, partial [Gammaproteobacteria bacterium]